MTRRSITTVLGSFFVGLFLVVQSPLVSAQNGCDPAEAGTVDQCMAMVNRVPGQNPAADAAQQYRQEMDAAAQAATLLATRPSAVSALGTMNQRVCTHPAVGFPTCFTAQDDGTWTREEWAETRMTRVVVGTMTFDEVLATIGEGNATAA
jgi:hypothetical protein